MGSLPQIFGGVQADTHPAFQPPAFSHLLKQAILFAQKRGWPMKLAKNRGNQQSLSGHSLSALWVAHTLAELLKTPLSLSEEEQFVVEVAAFLHDAGKETDDFQQYICGDMRKGVVYDTHPAHAHQVVLDFLEFLGVESPNLHADIVSSLLLHMKGARTGLAIFDRMLNAAHALPSWSLLKDLVILADQVVGFTNQDLLVNYLRGHFVSRYFQIEDFCITNPGIVYGSLIRQACEQSYRKNGWSPLISYESGGVWVAPLSAVSPSHEQVGEVLFSLIKGKTDGKGSVLVVGDSLTTTAFYPDFFKIDELSDYFRQAASLGEKYKRLDKKPYEEQFKRIKTYLNGREGNERDPEPEEVQRWSEVISGAYQEMALFHFFKRVLDYFAEKSAYPVRRKSEIIRSLLDSVFGEDFYDVLTQMSVFAPHLDMRVVDRYWRQPVAELSSEDEQVFYGQLHPDQRRTKLIELLVFLTEQLHQQLAPVYPSYEEMIRQSIAQEVKYLRLGDRWGIHPNQVVQLATQQLRAYGQSKMPGAQTKQRLCPVCNRHFEGEGKVVSSLYFGRSNAYTARLALGQQSGNSSQRVQVCASCMLERYLFRILFAGHRHFLVIFPRHPWTLLRDGMIVQKSLEVANYLQINRRFLNRSPRVRLEDRQKQIAQIAEHLSEMVEWLPNELDFFLGQTETDDDRIGQQVCLRFGLDEMDIQKINQITCENFQSVTEMVERIRVGDVSDMDLLDIHHQVKHHDLPFILRSPNLMILRWSQHYFSDLSLSNRRYKENLVELAMSMMFDANVRVVDESQISKVVTGRIGFEALVREEHYSVSKMISRFCSKYAESRGWAKAEYWGLQFIRPCFEALLSLLKLLPYTPKGYALSFNDLILRAVSPALVLKMLEANHTKNFETVRLLRKIEYFYANEPRYRQVVKAALGCFPSDYNPYAATYQEFAGRLVRILQKAKTKKGVILSEEEQRFIHSMEALQQSDPQQKGYVGAVIDWAYYYAHFKRFGKE